MSVYVNHPQKDRTQKALNEKNINTEDYTYHFEFFPQKLTSFLRYDITLSMFP